MKSYIKYLTYLSLFISTHAFADVSFYCSSNRNNNGSSNGVVVNETKEIGEKGEVGNIEYRAHIRQEMHSYFKELGIKDDWVTEKNETLNNLIISTYSLKDKGNNLLLKDNPTYDIHNETIELPTSYYKTKTLNIVSKKEILLAILQSGRSLNIVNVESNQNSSNSGITENNKHVNQGCSIEKLKDHIAIRQNIVAWTSDLEWQWPDGDAAQWNKKYWDRGTPYHKHSLVMAFNDLFFQQNRYGIGCYTASKIVMIQGILDYYARIKKDPSMVKKIETILWQGGEPLEDIEPPVMWQFEEDYDHSNDNLPGKLLFITKTAPENFIPGDWSYMLNTDTITYQKTGYEGSNAIYLGQNLFDDYYNDNQHSYTYYEKLNEVYQWRHHVFSHRRDKDKIEYLTLEQLNHLGKTPQQNGLLLEEKIAPIIF